ncbi:glycosyltransferase [Candidatus Micrarchaeota archaeon]|nr:glycosyltransferase [Candidatus Micrarchaeota archaeon]
MKIAICYEYLTTKGGAEKVVLELAKSLGADIYTLIYDEKTSYAEFKQLRVMQLGCLIKKSPFIQSEAIIKFRRLNLEKYDAIISIGNWAKQIVMNPRNRKVIHYECTPPRFLFDLKDTVEKRLNPVSKGFFVAWANEVRKRDIEASTKIKNYICISKNVQNRIKKYYGIDAEVIYPPAELERYKIGKTGDYFLSIQRLAPEKRVEIQIEAFRNLPKERLLIIGPPDNTQYFRKLKENAPKNVEFLGAVSQEEKINLLANCKAVIQTAFDEDLGLIPLEAMACGKICIAVNEGGFKETIINGKSGILINEPYVENLEKAIKELKIDSETAGVCQKRAAEFSTSKFVSKIKERINKVIK